MDQGWIKSGHIRGDVLRPISGSGMAIRGRHRARKWLQKAIDGYFVAISRPGGSKLVNQGWINLGHIHSDVLGPLPGSRMAIGGRRRHMIQKVLLWPFGLFFWPLWIMMAILDVEKVSNTLPRMCPN